MEATPPSEGEAMSADIIRLQSTVDALQRNVQDLSSRTGESLAALTARFDTVQELVREVTRLQERNQTNSTALERAFAAMARLEARLEARDSQDHDYRVDHATVHKLIDDKLSHARGWVAAGAVVGLLLLSVVTWQVQRTVDTIDKVTDRVQYLELQDARRPNP